MVKSVKRRMKIATMVRAMLPVPRPQDIMYSPLDVAVTLMEQLSSKGHKITYFGAQGSRMQHAAVVESKLRPALTNNDQLQKLLASADLFTYYTPLLHDQALAGEMFERAAKGEYDLLHFHHFESAMSYAKFYPNVPVVYTLHDVVDPNRRELIEAFLTHNQHFISISNSQRQSAPDLPYLATVHNGIDTELFKPDGKPEDYLLYIGRIVPDKGIKEGVELARQSNSRLLIIGQTPPSEQWYFDKYVKPYLNDKIQYLGYMGHEHLTRYYQKARAFIMPLQWEEPFGLTMAEASACGTPIVAMRRGSVPEIVMHGRTGFIVDSMKEMADALKHIDAIKRKDCREYALAHFSIQNMVDGYEAAFLQLLADNAAAAVRHPGLVGAVKKAAHPLIKPIGATPSRQRDIVMSKRSAPGGMQTA